MRFARVRRRWRQRGARERAAARAHAAAARRSTRASTDGGSKERALRGDSGGARDYFYGGRAVRRRRLLFFAGRPALGTHVGRRRQAVSEQASDNGGDGESARALLPTAFVQGLATVRRHASEQTLDGAEHGARGARRVGRSCARTTHIATLALKRCIATEASCSATDANERARA